MDAYVLITAAHNEEGYIEKTILSIVNQSLRPLKWIIASDASTDRTDEIVRSWAAKYDFIELLRIDRAPGFSFAAKANAINLACDRLKALPYEFIGILDADIACEPDYYSRLIPAFRNDERLGLSGGFIHETEGGVFVSRKGNRVWSVAGAAQLFRRVCFDAVGGIQPMPFGGEDWRAEVAARMQGWTVRANPDLKVLHYRHTGSANNPLRYVFRQGRMDYSMGSLPAFVVLKCLGRMTSPRLVPIAVARLSGFLWSYLAGPPRPVTREFMRFLRKEQRDRLLGHQDFTRPHIQPNTRAS